MVTIISGTNAPTIGDIEGGALVIQYAHDYLDKCELQTQRGI